MAKERIFVTAKTHPVLSRKYGELACTAGIRADGSWVRIHPVPLESLCEEGQYSKFDWIELDLVKSRRDRRPETYSSVDVKEIKVVGHVSDWRERRRLVLETPKAKVYDKLEPLVDGAMANTMSLAVFKPKRVRKFYWRDCERDWNAAKVAALQNNAAQGQLFESQPWRQTFKLIRKLPYDFQYRFVDGKGKESKMRVLDWDVGKFYWESLNAANSMESFACGSVHKRYFDEYRKTDLYFFLGTIHRFHTWVVIGVFPIPFET